MGARRLLIIGCSDGIGLAVAKRQISRGWHVRGISRSPSPLVGERYQHVVADVSHPEYPALLQSMVLGQEPFDACIYCAGVGAPFDVAHLESDVQVFEVNLMAAVQTAKAILPRMVDAGRGQMIVLSSQADELVSSDWPSYSASKAAMSAYFEGIGLALRPKGVVVTNLRFGFVETKMAKAKIKPFCLTVKKAADIVERCLATRPLRYTRPIRTAVLVGLLRFLQRWRIRIA